MKSAHEKDICRFYEPLYGGCLYQLLTDRKLTPSMAEYTGAEKPFVAYRCKAALKEQRRCSAYEYQEN